MTDPETRGSISHGSTTVDDGDEGVGADADAAGRGDTSGSVGASPTRAAAALGSAAVVAPLRYPRRGSVLVHLISLGRSRSSSSSPSFSRKSTLSPCPKATSTKSR